MKRIRALVIEDSPTARAHLRDQPIRLPPAAGAAVADCRRPTGPVAHPSRGARRELARLEDDTSANEAIHLLARATRRSSRRQIFLERRHAPPSGSFAGCTGVASTSTTSP